jgi:hypothetical protein
MSQEMTQTSQFFGPDGLDAQEHYTNLAKKLSLKGTDRYFIKFFDVGSQRGTPVNPLGVGYVADFLKPNTAINATMTSFRPVSEEAFNIYLKFLSTKNELYHRTVINLTK